MGYLHMLRQVADKGHRWEHHSIVAYMKEHRMHRRRRGMLLAVADNVQDQDGHYNKNHDRLGRTELGNWRDKLLVLVLGELHQVEEVPVVNNLVRELVR